MKEKVKKKRTHDTWTERRVDGERKPKKKKVDTGRWLVVVFFFLELQTMFHTLACVFQQFEKSLFCALTVASLGQNFALES